MPASGGADNENQRQAAAREPGSSTAPPRSRWASGPSVATTTARAARVSPPARYTVPASIRSTRHPSRTDPSGSHSASCAGIAPIPRAGTAVGPTASIFRITSNRRLDTSRSGSSWMPANSGLQNSSTIRSENPSDCSRSSVVTSGRRSRSGADRVRTDSTSLTNRALSPNEPIGAMREVIARDGCRNGSPTTCIPPSVRTTAPGANGRRSSASRSRRRCTSG